MTLDARSNMFYCIFMWIHWACCIPWGCKEEGYNPQVPSLNLPLHHQSNNYSTHLYQVNYFDKSFCSLLQLYSYLMITIFTILHSNGFKGGLGGYIFHFLLLSLTNPSVADKIGTETINLIGANFVTLTYKVIRL